MWKPPGSSGSTPPVDRFDNADGIDCAPADTDTDTDAAQAKLVGSESAERVTS